MSNFSRNDIKKFFQDTLKESYEPMGAVEEPEGDSFADPGAAEMRAARRRQRAADAEAGVERPVIHVDVPDDSGAFDSMMKRRARRRAELAAEREELQELRSTIREMIEEAVLKEQAQPLQEVAPAVATAAVARGSAAYVTSVVALADYLIYNKTPVDRANEVMQLHDELKKNSEVYSSLLDLARAIRELPPRVVGKAGEALKSGLIAAIEEATEGLDSIAADDDEEIGAVGP